jgi:hypothetical protein
MPITFMFLVLFYTCLQNLGFVWCVIQVVQLLSDKKLAQIQHKVYFLGKYCLTFWVPFCCIFFFFEKIWDSHPISCVCCLAHLRFIYVVFILWIFLLSSSEVLKLKVLMRIFFLDQLSRKLWVRLFFVCLFDFEFMQFARWFFWQFW